MNELNGYEKEDLDEYRKILIQREEIVRKLQLYLGPKYISERLGF
jgi:recombination DNA repair RAD52 pathway protein